MAIYHFSGTAVSRSKGRSAVACAAYRAGEKLHDERYDKDYDYTKKKDVVHAEILLPNNAQSKLKDRETLWNEVEKNENRKDAQLAREFNFALPRELTLEQNILLSREFVKESFVKEGMIADLCIHNDKSSDGLFHPHAHVMLTMREVTENGFGKKVRAWNDKALLMSWREAWAEMANKHLALNGHDLVIDHRSLADQQIALEPQYKIGASVARDQLVRMEDHQRIARENGEKLILNPEIALHAITRQQSTFTHQDLARFVNRHTVNADQFLVVYEKVKQCDQMVSLGLDDKNHERFTSKEMLKLESRMMEQAAGLSKREKHAVKAVFQEKALSQKELTLEQKTAFDHLVSRGDLKCVVGFAGTGKSYLLGSLREAWESQGFTVSGVTLSGIAAENLEGSSGILSRTYASRCYYWDKGEERLGKNDVLVVDEAGMLSSRQMARLVGVAYEGGAKVVLVGDPQQLQAIEAGAAFRAISERVNYVELTDIRRQTYEWQREATKELAKGEMASAVNRYANHSHVHEFETQAVAKAALVEAWNEGRLANPSQTQIMLAYNKSDVLELNQLARGLRHAQGELGRAGQPSNGDVSFQTERGERAFASRDRVYFLKNDRSLGVMNGSLGTIEAIKEGMLTIKLDNSSHATEQLGEAKRVSITMERYPHLDHGYAATIHKAQGVTVDRSYVLASQYLDSHSTYVAMSRHRDSVDLFYGKDTFLTKEDLIKTLGRDRAKDTSLDYFNRASDPKEPSLADERLMRQEKIRAFTESVRLEQTTQLGHKEHRSSNLKELDELDQSVRELIDSKTGSLKKDNHQDLRDFKRQFEAKNPERALSLREELVPEHERKAIALVQEFNRLEALVEKGGRSSYLAQEHLEKLVEKMSRQKDVMEYVHKHQEPMAKQINHMAKELQRGRDLDLER
jgi:Ti-type conjugative transfer relaxase TraA